jgi:hypothetical protein
MMCDAKKYIHYINIAGLSTETKEIKGDVEMTDVIKEMAKGQRKRK